MRGGGGSSRRPGRLVDGLHNRLRAWLAPLDAVVDAVPDGGGDVLDLGCGQGLVLRDLPASGRRLVGIDFDARKCRMAREMLAGRGDVEIVQGDIIDFLRRHEDARYAAVTVVDTLSSLPEDDQRRVLELAAARLAPGGRLLLKVVDTDPRWKAAIARGMYLLVYRALRLSLSADQEVFYRPSGWYRERLEGAGLRTRVVRLHRVRHLPVPHVLIVGERAA